MKKKENKIKSASSEDSIHPGAFTETYDKNNDLLDTINAADDIFKYNIRDPRRNANPASPSAGDPPVPNRAHTEM